MDNAERDGKIIDDINEGNAAKKLANNKIWKGVIAELETNYIDAIRSGSWVNFSGGINIGKKAREENCRRLQVLDELVVLINNKIVEGEQAQTRLEANKNGSKQRRS